MTSLTHPQIKTLPLGADYKQIAGGFQKIHTLYHRTISDCFSDVHWILWADHHPLPFGTPSKGSNNIREGGEMGLKRL